MSLEHIPSHNNLSYRVNDDHYIDSRSKPFMNFVGDLFSDLDEMLNQASVSPSLLEIFKAFQDEISGRIPSIKYD